LKNRIKLEGEIVSSRWGIIASSTLFFRERERERLIRRRESEGFINEDV
jgi:hypothetical protein